MYFYLLPLNFVISHITYVCIFYLCALNYLLAVPATHTVVRVRQFAFCIPSEIKQ